MAKKKAPTKSRTRYGVFIHMGEGEYERSATHSKTFSSRADAKLAVLNRPEAGAGARYYFVGETKPKGRTMIRVIH